MFDHRSKHQRDRQVRLALDEEFTALLAACEQMDAWIEYKAVRRERYLTGNLGDGCNWVRPKVSFDD
jgi:hypothetical protein